MKYLLAIFAGAAALAAVPAISQPAAPPTAPVAAPQSRAQVVDHVRAMFARLDGNRDGVLTKAEAQAGRAMHGRRAGQNAVRQRDPARVAQRQAQAFDRFDANRDGAISRAEWNAMSAQRQQRRFAKGDKARGPRMTRRGLGGRMFDVADVNRDGRVTIVEAQNAALQRFDRMDVNRDGQISPEERRQMRQQMRAQRRS